jgi:hypothetical protein
MRRHRCRELRIRGRFRRRPQTSVSRGPGSPVGRARCGRASSSGGLRQYRPRPWHAQSSRLWPTSTRVERAWDPGPDLRHWRADVRSDAFDPRSRKWPMFVAPERGSPRPPDPGHAGGPALPRCAGRSVLRHVGHCASPSVPDGSRTRINVARFGNALPCRGLRFPNPSGYPHRPGPGASVNLLA